MDKQLKTNLTNVDHWVRLAYMLLFGIMLVVARAVIWVIALLQFLLILFSGRDNKNLRNLGQGTAKWCYQSFMYLTFNSDRKPFPFADWPELDEVRDDDSEVKKEQEVEIESENSQPILPKAVDEDVPSFTDDRTEDDDKKG